FVRWFMASCPTEMLTQVKYAPTGVDEQASLLLRNKEEQMATVMFSLHSKQPKRGTLSFDKAYIELYEYPRGEKAVITWTADGHQEEILAGSTAEALQYEVLDMEKAVAGDPAIMHLDYTRDVMQLMTKARNTWGMKYPEEE
ncbi:MAG: gfo/Idh/MocA family oxidoreductase, partial [Selenomonas sp.]|nr:gfo/Idh/MocA family oxidoreductase [Selenomonas sp.]